MTHLRHRILTACVVCIVDLCLMVGVITANPIHDHYRTVPDSFPKFTVTVPSGNVADGYIFLAAYTTGQLLDDVFPYLIILDNNGEPVYYQRYPNGYELIDLHPQEDRPEHVFTYFVREHPDRNQLYGLVMDNTYSVTQRLDSVGYQTYENDYHEVVLTPDNTVIMLIYDRHTVDLSGVVEGGRPNATVVDLVVQEFDQDRNVLFEWSTEGNIQITQTASINDLTNSFIDYVHGNSVDIDTDGHLLVLLRDINQILKLNRQTGEIIWRLGGYNSDFTVVGDTEMFVLAHSVRRLANGNIQLFDNQRRPDPTYSRVVEYAVDEVNMSVEQVWEWKHPGNIYASFAANAERLPNDNVFIGWGGSVRTPSISTTTHATVSEVNLDGTIEFELQMESPYISYRAYRSPWVGNPTEPPTLIGEFDGETGTLALFYSWNGATDVASYNIYGGSDSPNALTLIGTQEKTGFEEMIVIDDPLLNTTVHYQIIPLDAAGNELTPSNTFSILTTPTNIGLTTTNITPKLPIMVIFLVTAVIMTIPFGSKFSR